MRASLTALNPTHYLITLMRSPRGLPPASAATARALGLHRLHQSVIQPIDATAAGKILRIKELVTVRNVTEEEGILAMARRRPEGSGVVPTGRAYGGLKSDTGAQL